MAYQPWQGYLTANTSAVQNVMKMIYDPVILDMTLRAGDATRFFKPMRASFPKGKTLVIRNQDQSVLNSRFFGTPFYESGSVGRVLPTPQGSPTWINWEVDHNELFGVACGIRYAWPTDRVMDEQEVGTAAERLARDTVADLAESVERATVNQQNGHVAKVVGISNSTAAYAALGANLSTGNTTARLWLDRTPVLLHQGAVIDLIPKDVGAVAASYRGGIVKHIGTENPASGIFGFIDVDLASQTSTAASFSSIKTQIAAASIYPFVFMSGEWVSGKVPDAAPAACSGMNHPYGLPDWFKSLSGSGEQAAGVIYNLTRTTLGQQWTIPTILDKHSSKADVAVAMSYMDDLTLTMNHVRLDQETGLTNYLWMGGPFMTHKLTTLTDAANRRVDSEGVKGQPIVTNYGFDGIMLHHPSLGAPVGVQPVRGLREDCLYLVQPGVLELYHLGEPNWLDWSPGVTWQQETYSDGAQGGTKRTLIYRADRLFCFNTMMRVPMWNAGLIGVKPA